MILNIVRDFVKAFMVLSAMWLAFTGQVEKANYILLLVLVFREGDKTLGGEK